MGELKIDRAWLNREPLWPPHLTAEQAFEEGRRMGAGEKPEGEDSYSMAARAYARIIVECADRHPEGWRVIANIIKSIEKCPVGFHERGGGQDILLNAIGLFDKCVADEQHKADERRIGPSGFQAGWAFQAAHRALESEAK